MGREQACRGWFHGLAIPVEPRKHPGLPWACGRVPTVGYAPVSEDKEMTRFIRLSSCLLLVACNGGDKEETGGLPVICNAGTSWEPGWQAFRAATDDWGIYDFDATGVRLAAVDFDGDGWTDLAIRYATDTPDDFGGGQVYTWLLRNTGQKSFEDVTVSSGVRQTRSGADEGRPGQVWAFADVDNDGDLDLFTGLTDLDDSYDETSEIMLNNGDGTFSLGPDSSDIRYDGDTSPAGAAFVDFDRDGIVDLWVPEYYYAQDRLYRGLGDGSFTDVTYDAQLNTKSWSNIDDLNAALAHTVAWSALACDLNNDGYAELMAASYGRAPNHLWLADGDGTFTNQSVASGYAYDDRVDWSDNESARCWCYLHPDDEGCDGVPPPENIICNEDDDAFRWDNDYDRELFRLGGNSGATICADVDNDGWADLLTTEIVHWDVGESSDPSELLFNTASADVVFQRPGNDVTGLTREHESADWNDGDMTGDLFDFDNDGWPDVYIGSSDYEGTRGLLYHQDSARSFSAVPLEDGIDHTRSHGIVVADFDHDGDLDVVVGHSSARCEDDCYDTFSVRFFENVVGEDQGLQGNFIQLTLEGGEGSNKAAIGARVEVTADGVTQTHQVDGGHGHYGAQDDLTQHFGLGSACQAQVTITWPDAVGSQQSFTLGGGYRYLVKQGQDPQPIL